MIVYVTDQGSKLFKRGRRLLIKKGQNIIRWFHTKDVEQIILMGNIGLSSQAVTFLLKNKIDTVFLSYYGNYKGRLVGEFGKNVKLRIQQQMFLSDNKNRINLAKTYIKAKIHNQIQHLKIRNRNICSDKVTASILKIKSIAQYELNDPKSLDSIRGIEGIAAKYYFEAFPQLIKNQNFQFTNRNRRPPKDEPNALLSLAYTLLLNQIASQIYIAGLDPFIGALHDIDYGRQSLVLDIMEEFRPIIDNFVLNLINRNQIKSKHFSYSFEKTSSDDNTLPVCLTADGMKKFIFAFTKLLNSKFYLKDINADYALKNIFLRQARLLIKHIKSEKDYNPFVWSPF